MDLSLQDDDEMAAVAEPVWAPMTEPALALLPPAAPAPAVLADVPESAPTPAEELLLFAPFRGPAALGHGGRRGRAARQAVHDDDAAAALRVADPAARRGSGLRGAAGRPAGDRWSACARDHGGAGSRLLAAVIDLVILGGIDALVVVLTARIAASR
ncbi:MAG: hypothetical protein R2712_04055 [Vicinamibacterales bacterium]